MFGVPGLLDYQAEIYREEGKDHLRIETLSATKHSKEVSAEVVIQRAGTGGQAFHTLSLFTLHRRVWIESRDVSCDGKISWRCRLRLEYGKNSSTMDLHHAFGYVARLVMM